MIEDTNRCVVCGDIIPEGRQVCPVCERQACLHVWLFDGFEWIRGERMLRWKCDSCGRLQVRKEVVREW